jgi:hypothetical protein
MVVDGGALVAVMFCFLLALFGRGAGQIQLLLSAWP